MFIKQYLCIYCDTILDDDYTRDYIPVCTNCIADKIISNDNNQITNGIQVSICSSCNILTHQLIGNICESCASVYMVHISNKKAQECSNCHLIYDAHIIKCNYCGTISEDLIIYMNTVHNICGRKKKRNRKTKTKVTESSDRI